MRLEAGNRKAEIITAFFCPFELSSAVCFEIWWVWKDWQPFGKLRVTIKVHVLSEKNTKPTFLATPAALTMLITKKPEIIQKVNFVIIFV